MKRTVELGARPPASTVTSVRERDHLPGRRAAHVDRPDVLRTLAVLGLGLHVHAVEAAEAVEVVDVGAAERSPESAAKTSSIGTPSLRAFSRSSSTATCGDVGSNAVNRLASSGRWRAPWQEAGACAAEFGDRQRAAAVLEAEVEPAGRAEAGNRRRQERERDRLGDLRQLAPQVRR